MQEITILKLGKPQKWNTHKMNLQNGTRLSKTNTGKGHTLLPQTTDKMVLSHISQHLQQHVLQGNEGAED